MWRSVLEWMRGRESVERLTFNHKVSMRKTARSSSTLLKPSKASCPEISCFVCDYCQTEYTSWEATEHGLECVQCDWGRLEKIPNDARGESSD